MPDTSHSFMHDLFEILHSLIPPALHDRFHLVGGAVRDLLLVRPVTDLDLTASLPPEVLTSLGFRLVEGISTSPIWLRHLPGVAKIEITLLTDRTERDRDLRRRDFTVNAMAMSLQGELYDPLGGRNDLESRLLRPCSDSIFTDDPIRIFRAFRFSADGWELSPECSELIRSCSEISPPTDAPIERFSREMLKALAGRSPERFFLLMHEYTAGSRYLPELFRMAGVPAGPPVYHPEGDLLTHSLQVLQRVAAATDDPVTRFCAFFHDLGKLATEPSRYPRHHGHEEAGYHAAPGFCSRLKLPACYGRSLAWCSRLHGKLYKWDEMRDVTKILTSEQALRAGIEVMLPLVAAADKVGSTPPVEWQSALAIASMTTEALGLDSIKLAAVPPERRKEMILQKKGEMLRTNRTYGA